MLDAWKIAAVPMAEAVPAAKAAINPARAIIGNWRCEIAVGGQRMYILSTFKAIHDRNPLFPDSESAAERILHLYDEYAAHK